jgi:uncharacterized protein
MDVMTQTSTTEVPAVEEVGVEATSRWITPVNVLIASHGLAAAVLLGGGAPGEIARSVTALAITAGAIVVDRRPRTWLSDLAVLVFGLAGLMAGVGVGIQQAIVGGASLRTVAGVALIPSGLALVAIACRRLLRPLRTWRKLVALPIAVVALVMAVLPITLSVFVTNVPHYPLGEATPADFGLDYDDVTVSTADGVDLEAWYIPSTNGAALVQLGGCCAARDDELEYAALLAGHGYGVLMLDQRGHGGSEGHGMIWGWWGELDVAAGVDFLAVQPDVLDGRIGAIGMSVGGEQVIAAAGTDPRIRAAVAEGVTARGARDEGDPASGVGGLFVRYTDWLTKNAAAMMTSADKPTQMREAIASMSPEQRVLVINAGTIAEEIAAAETFEAVDPQIVTTWIAADASHIDALSTYPDEWEQRVAAFLDSSLAPA